MVRQLNVPQLTLVIQRVAWRQDVETGQIDMKMSKVLDVDNNCGEQILQYTLPQKK